MSDLRTAGAQVTATGGGVVLITEYAGQSLNPPLILHLTESQFDAVLESYGDDARAVFASDSSLEGAYKLFLVHLDEVIATLRPGQNEIRVVAGSLQSFHALAPDPLPARVQGARWTAEWPPVSKPDRPDGE